MRLNDGNRYEEIKQVVVDLFEKCDVRCTPISGHEIAHALGINVIPYSAFPPSKRSMFMELSEDGCAGYEDGVWRIAYNDDPSRPYGRSNFTILREIGHIVLNHTEDSELADSEADFFAKFAQCPPVLIHKLGLKTVGDIMECFEISYGAACNALTYYHTWLRYHGSAYTEYEIRTCILFGIAV